MSGTIRVDDELMGKLAKNTFFLYALTAANYLFGLATIPYISRILGPSIFGNLGFAMAFGAYFSLIIDFGFILSATKKVTMFADDKLELSKIFSAVTFIKLSFALIVFIALAVSRYMISEIANNFALLTLFLILSALTSLLPDYIYMGLENMKIIAIRGVAIKAIFVSLIFVCLKSPEQVYFVPLFQIIGSIIVIIWIYFDLHKNQNIKFTKTTLRYLITIIKDSAPYFLSRIASSVYNFCNTIILGFIYPGKPVVGYYTSADKFRSLAQQGCSPVADSFYPYMIRTKDYKKLLRTVLILEIPIIIILAICFIWSDEICIIAFGKEYLGSSELLRWMIPIMALTLPQYMFGFPALTPIGKAKWANISVEIATVNQIGGLIILFITDSVSAINLCILTTISEIICLSIRIATLVANKKLLKNEPKTF